MCLHYRERLQGVAAPVMRTEQHFDPASTPLITQQDFPATRDFVTSVLHYQILEALCAKAGATNVRYFTFTHRLLYPLQSVTCNLRGAREAGALLQKAMALGSSRPWPDVLEGLTGTRHMDIGPLLRHYEPLLEWLQQENARNNEHIGWDGPGTAFTRCVGRRLTLIQALLSRAELPSSTPPPPQPEPTGDSGLIPNNNGGGNLSGPPIDSGSTWEQVVGPGGSCSGNVKCIMGSTCSSKGICECSPPTKLNEVSR